MGKSKHQSGFTLIEIAIVLVIIGLLLGGVLKGQELITGARVRNLIQQQDGVKAAYFGFLDRYRALPGDFNGATKAINGAEKDGDGNGKIEEENTSTTNKIKEHVAAWNHLAKAGFLNGSYTYGTSGDQNDASNPKNPYGGFLQIVFDDVYGDGKQSKRHNLKTGPNIPVEILAEIDRKTDDGAPYTGSFQSSTYASAAGASVAPATGVTASTGCLSTDGKTWNATGGLSNCGAATLY
jgi:prepilin-type N-terminal cleavage/methylation domain-containing protein